MASSPKLKRINILLASMLGVFALILYFTLPAALFTGDDLTLSEIRANIQLSLGWKCLGSPATLFRIHRAERRKGELGADRERLQLRCALSKQDPPFAAETAQIQLNRAVEPAIYDKNLTALSIAVFSEGRTVCFFPALNEWTQCEGRRSCLRGACKNSNWLNLTKDQ